MTAQRRMLICFPAVAVLLLLPVPSGCRTWTRAEQKASEAYNRANTLREEGSLEEAEEAYRLALKFNPNMAAPAFNLALTLAELERFPDALDILKRLRKRDSENLEIIRAAAWMHLRAGDAQEALSFYREALAVFEADQESLRGIAGIFEDSGRLSEGLEYRRALVRLDPSNTHRRELARALAAADRFAEALDEYRMLILDTQGDSSLFTEAAEAALESAEAAEAARYYQQAVKLEADNAEAWISLASVRFTRLEDYEGGLEALGAALESGLEGNEHLEALIAAASPDIRPSIRKRMEQVTQPEAEAP